MSVMNDFDDGSWGNWQLEDSYASDGHFGLTVKERASLERHEVRPSTSLLSSNSRVN